jgi:hypothetical protein
MQSAIRRRGTGGPATDAWTATWGKAGAFETNEDELVAARRRRDSARGRHSRSRSSSRCRRAGRRGLWAPVFVPFVPAAGGARVPPVVEVGSFRILFRGDSDERASLAGVRWLRHRLRVCMEAEVAALRAAAFAGSLGPASARFKRIDAGKFAAKAKQA